MMIPVILLAVYLVFNLAVFLVYRRDKQAAQQSERRVRESTLLWLAFLGGSAGAVLAQRLLRHKTRKEPFRSILLSIIVLQLGLVASLLIMPDWPQRLLVFALTLLQNPKP